MHQQHQAIDRLPPHSVEHEMALLGAMMLGTQEDREDVLARLSDRDFYQPDHAEIFKSIRHLHERQGKLDAATVRQHLSDRGVLEDVGGAQYLGEILSAVPDAGNYSLYAGTVAEKSKLRRLIEAAQTAIDSCHAPSATARADGIATLLAEEAEEAREVGRSDEIHHIEGIVHRVMDELGSHKETRIETGIASLDDMFGGLPVEGYTIVGGRPGMGKSQLCKQLVKNIAKRGIPCGIISVEESEGKIVRNYLSSESGVENNRIEYNRLGPEEWPSISEAGGKLAAMPIYISDSPLSVQAIRSVARRMVRRHGCRVIAIDHLHIIQGDGNPSRVTELTRVSAAIKGMFKSLGVAGIAAAQLNRASESREVTMPQLRDLRECGALEQDGDLILLLHRADYYRPPGEQRDHLLTVNVAKNKAGSTGIRNLKFEGRFQRITDPEGGYARPEDTAPF